MKSFLLSRQAIHRISLLSSKTPTFCRNFSAITSTISHSDRHLRSYDEQTPFQNVEIPRPISSFNRYFHFTRESRLSESSAAIDDSNDQEEDDEDGTTNEFLSRFVWIMRGKVSEAYPDCDKKMIDGMLLLIVEKVVEEIERGGFNKVGSAPPSPSSEFSDDLWATIWEVSNTVLKDMEKERKKEKMKQYVQSPEVMEMCRFAGEIGIRGDLLRELRFKWAREKMDDAEFYESLEQQRDLDNSIRESETVDGEVEEEGFVPSDEVESRSISLPKRKGKLKYKIYGLELSDPKWVEMADKIHEAEEEADWREPKPVTGKCKLVMEKLESLQEGDDPSGLLAEWAELLEPNRVDWIALINQLREGNTHAYLKVAEGVLDEKSFNASISDYSKLIHIHAKENHIEDVERILKKMSQNGIFPDILTATALVHMYSKSGNFERATEAFENLKSYGLRPDEKIYEAMILGYVNAGKPKLGERLMKEMQAKELKASEEVYMALLRAYAQMGDANGAAGISSSMQYASDGPLSFEAYSLFVEAYGKAGQVDKAKSNFDEMRKLGHKPDDKCIANLVRAYKGENSLDKALRLLLQLEKDGIEIGVITYTVLVDWMANLGLIEEAEQLLVKISQLGEAPPFELQVSLCCMYSGVAHLSSSSSSLCFSSFLMPRNIEPLDLGIQIPYHFRCPISLELMQDPVTVCTGQTYDRASIESWVSIGNNTTCPVTRAPLSDFTLIPNHTLRRLIQEWCVANRSNGVERIPTPKQPADPTSVRALLSQASAITGTHVSVRSRAAALRRLRGFARDSDKNRVLIAAHNATEILIKILFSETTSSELVSESLALLVMLPITEPNQFVSISSDPGRVEFLTRLLFDSSIETRVNAAALIEIVSTGTKSADLKGSISNSESVFEGVLDLLRNPISSRRALKIGIKTLFALCSVKSTRHIAITAGAPEILIDRLAADFDRCDTERALATVELLCRTPEGCAAFGEHALTVPLLVKTILRVSDRATEYAAGALLALCTAEERWREEAAGAGVVVQLLLMVQSECTERAKKKAQKLLKLLRDSWPDYNSFANSDDFGCSSQVVPF